MKFRTAYSRDRSICPSGSRYRKTYVRGADGVLKEAGVEDVFDSIQKAGDGLALADLIRRAERGDQTAIGDPVDSFADITGAPTDLLDAHMKLSAARDTYNSLPAEVKAAFGNDFQTMLTAIGDGSVVEKLSQLAKSAPAPQTAPLAPQSVINSTEGGVPNA